MQQSSLTSASMRSFITVAACCIATTAVYAQDADSTANPPVELHNETTATNANMAGDTSDDADATDEESTDDDVLIGGDSSNRQYQWNFLRARAVAVPGFVTGLFFSERTTNWSGGRTNFAFGSEFIVRRPHEYDIVLGLEYANLNIADGYWLENGDPARDADWTESESFGLASASVAIHWITDLNDASTWQLYYGLGIGVSVVLGNIWKYDIRVGCLGGDTESEDPAVLEQCLDEDGVGQFDESSRTREDRVPPAIPDIALAFGTRWIVADHWAIGIEIGMEPLPTVYGGLELGYVF